MATAQEMYEKYLEAEMKILKGQTVRMNNRLLTRADLTEVRKGRAEWERKLSRTSHAKVSFYESN